MQAVKKFNQLWMNTEATLTTIDLTKASDS